MTHSAAYRAARVELGNPTVTRERVRDAGWENTLETLIVDVRYGLRRLRSNPGFTAVSAITLALGIGATTVIFSAINPILFKALPYPHAERVLMVSDVGNDGTPMAVTFGTYREILLRNHSFDALAPFKAWQPTVEGGAEPERLSGQAVGADYFRALGVAPIRGRDFTTADDRDGGPRVVILSDALWHRRFGGDPRHHRSQRDARRRSVPRHRRHAADVRERSGDERRHLEAAPIQDGVHAGVARMGTSSASRWARSLRRRSRGGARRPLRHSADAARRHAPRPVGVAPRRARRHVAPGRRRA